MKNSKVIVALDFDDIRQARELIATLNPDLCALKIGKNMFTQFGPDFVSELVKQNYRVFLDLKYHDIPKTVADACRQAAKLGIWMLNVHASGGEAMMRAARRAIDEFPQRKRPLLIAVTVLTSLDDDDLKAIGMHTDIEKTVSQLAKSAQQAGCDGVVCSAQEAALLRSQCGDGFVLVTPGIRLAGDASGDQKRIVTPQQAIKNGADYLVMGRSITQAADPLTVLKELY